jgi:hypothetical protein
MRACACARQNVIPECPKFDVLEMQMVTYCICHEMCCICIVYLLSAFHVNTEVLISLSLCVSVLHSGVISCYKSGVCKSVHHHTFN